MSHYTWHNVTESSRVTTKYVKISRNVVNWNAKLKYCFLLRESKAKVPFTDVLLHF